MSNSQALDIPKAVEKRLPECEAYVRSLSLSPEQKQMYAQAAKNVCLSFGRSPTIEEAGTHTFTASQQHPQDLSGSKSHT